MDAATTAHPTPVARRGRALERAYAAARRLGEPATPDGLLARAAAELAAGPDFARVLISEVAGATLVPLALCAPADPDGGREALRELGAAPIALAYPLVELEVARRRVPQAVAVAAARARTPAALTRCLGWTSYVVAPLAIGGDTLGLLHADAGVPGRALDALDAELAATFTSELAGALERAALRQALARHRAELATAVQWMGGRLDRLEDDGALRRPRPATPGADAVHSLTGRELDVLRLLTRGHTNAAIARSLSIGEGTVKYYVKNVLRKLGASSRAEAVARFVRASGDGGGPG